MKKGNISKLLSKDFEKIVTNLGYEYVDTEFVKDYGSNVLRVLVYKKGGIIAEDCKIISLESSKFLDKKDPIKYPYMLEVSSPGLSRPLYNDKDLNRNIGNEIEVKTYKTINGAKNFIGILESFDNDFLMMNSNGENIKIKREDISKSLPYVRMGKLDE